MPDPTQDNQNANIAATPAPAGNPMIPSAGDITSLPSDFQVSPTTPPAVAEPTVSTETPAGPTGSAAPADLPPSDLPPITAPPKKKFGSGRIIATILGLLLLVGGIGAGIVLTGQTQLFEQKASGGCGDHTSASDCNGECSPPKGANNDQFACKWHSATQKCSESAQVCGGNPGCTETITAGNCSGSGFQCGAVGASSNCRFCLVHACTRTCNQILSDRGCDVVIGDQCSQIDSAVTTYYCQGTASDPSSGTGSTGGQPNGCQKNDPLPSGVHWDSTNHRITGNFCGIVQVDENDSTRFCSRSDTSGCSTNTTTETASCTNVKAYNSAYAPLTTAQMSTLARGTVINFCVVGATSAGTFDQARFTINGTTLAPTTTKRPGTQDYCQSYTIPATGNSFNVTAQIHHATLGWR